MGHPPPVERQLGNRSSSGTTETLWNDTDWQLVQYWNSCDTDTVKSSMNACIPTAGSVAAIAAVVAESGTVAVGDAIIGLGCGLFKEYIEWAENRSDLDAVIQAFPRDGGKGSFAPTRYVKATPQ